MIVIQALESVRWITLRTAEGPLRALAFYARPDRLETYVGKWPLPQVAQNLARACGHLGSGAEYLYQTVAKLEELGIHDRNLWKLQELVAREIIKMKDSQAAATPAAATATG